MEAPEDVREAMAAVEEASQPLDAVIASRRLRAALDRWERQLVGEASAQGQSWDAVGRALGLSRQAAWERYRKAGPDPSPARSLEAARQRQRTLLADARRLRAEARAPGASREERAELHRQADDLRAQALAAMNDDDARHEKERATET